MASTRSKLPRLLAIESPFPQEHFMLRLLEPAGSCQEKLWKRLCDGTYDKPFVLDNGRRRYLRFDFDGVQSAMVSSAPERLVLAYTRKMMAFLLFNRNPQRILLLGLGGGSLTKFCHSRLPAATLTVVEVNSDVIALRHEFCIPADDSRFRVIHADGVAHISSAPSSADVILADACDRAGIAAEFNSLEFYRNARNCLAPGGIFVTNVCGDKRSRAEHLAKLRHAFDDELLALQMTRGGNTIVFGFKECRPATSWKQLEESVAELRRPFGIDFLKYARRLFLDNGGAA
jgi:spermidine synthase